MSKYINCKINILRQPLFNVERSLSHPEKVTGYHPQSLNHPEVISDARSADDLDFLFLSGVRTPENLIRD